MRPATLLLPLQRRCCGGARPHRAASSPACGVAAAAGARWPVLRPPAPTLCATAACCSARSHTLAPPSAATTALSSTSAATRLPYLRGPRLLSSSTAPPSSSRLPPPAATPSSSSSSSSSSGWLPNPVELVKREAGLQSNRLDTALRERVETAIERLGGRVTVGDVATRAGVKLGEADEALKALAYDTQAALQVSTEGDVVYAFAADFRARLASRSLAVRAAPLLRGAAAAGAYLVRVAFGTALVASVVLVWLALAALLRGRDDDRGGDRGGGYSYSSSSYHSYHSARMFMDVTDLFLYWDPYYYRTAAQRAAAGEPLSFVEAVFSFVFGDGDPNAAWQEARWQALGAMITDKGGVVTAEEMAPYLDPPEPAAPPPRLYGAGGVADDEPYVPYPDEGFVLPALIKFGGEPEVGERGHLLYRFPALQRTGVTKPRWANKFGASQPEYDVPMEREWEFTAASPGQVVGTVLLGGLNLVGVALLSAAMADPRSAYVLAAQGLGWIAGLMGPLQAYALAFFAVPAFRWFLNAKRNAAIESRNDARTAATDLLNGGGAGVVEAKVAAARSLGERAAPSLSGSAAGRARLGPKAVGAQDVVFDSGRPADSQVNDQQLDDWDARLERRGGSGGGGGGGVGGAGGARRRFRR